MNAASKNPEESKIFLEWLTSSEFAGKTKIEQHRMVYNSLKGKMGNELHALAIKTKE